MSQTIVVKCTTRLSLYLRWSYLTICLFVKHLCLVDHITIYGSTLAVDVFSLYNDIIYVLVLIKEHHWLVWRTSVVLLLACNRTHSKLIIVTLLSHNSEWLNNNSTVFLWRFKPCQQHRGSLYTLQTETKIPLNGRIRWELHTRRGCHQKCTSRACLTIPIARTTMYVQSPQWKFYASPHTL